MSLVEYTPPSLALAVAEPQNRWLELLTPAAELANQIAGTEFVPDAMRNKPAAVAACILYGAEIGIGPMQALAKVDIVKGRPAPRAELARALALAAGHEVWVQEQSNTRVIVCGRRRGSSNVQTVTWTMDDVRKAGIASGMYQKYPRQMLLARASAELVRMMAPDVLGGIAMFAEEADVDTFETVAVQEPAAAAPAKPAGATRKRSTPAAAAAPSPPTPAAELAPAGERPPLPGEDDTPADGVLLATEAQIKKMMACFNEIGIKAREDRLAFITAAAREVETSKDLTAEEAGTVIDTLEAVIESRVVIEHVDGQLTLTAVDDDGAPGDVD